MVPSGWDGLEAMFSYSVAAASLSPAAQRAHTAHRGLVAVPAQTFRVDERNRGGCTLITPRAKQAPCNPQILQHDITALQSNFMRRVLLARYKPTPIVIRSMKSRRTIRHTKLTWTLQFHQTTTTTTPIAPLLVCFPVAGKPTNCCPAQCPSPRNRTVPTTNSAVECLHRRLEESALVRCLPE